MNDEADSTPVEEASRKTAFEVSCPLCGSPSEAEARDSQVRCSACGLAFQPPEPEPEPLPIEPEEAPLPDDPASVLNRWLAGEEIGSASPKIPRRRYYQKHPFATALIVVAVVVVVLSSVVPTVAYLHVSSDLARRQIEDKRTVQALRSQKQHLQDRLKWQRQDSQRRLELGDRRLREAHRRTERAVSDVKTSWSKRLSADAQRLREENPDRSVLLAAEALHLTSTGGGPMLPEARQILHDSLDGNDGRRLTGHTDHISSLAISSDGRLLASGSYDRTVRLWNLEDADPSASAEVLDGHGGYVSGVRFGPDDQWLASGSFDSTVRIWDLGAEDPAASPMVLSGHRGRIGIVALSRDGRWLVTGSSGFKPAENSTRLWDLSTPGPSASSVELRGHLGKVYAVAVSPDNRWIVTAGEGGTARLWNLTAEHPEATSISLNGHSGTVRCASFSADSRHLVTGSDSVVAGDPTLNLWNLADKKSLGPVVLPGHPTGVLATIATSDAQRVISLGKDNNVRIWNLSQGKPVAEAIVLPGDSATIETMTVSSNGRWLVTGDDNGTARIWDLASQNAPQTSTSSVALKGHQGRITAMAVSPDNHWLVIAGDDNVIRMWTLRVDELIDLALLQVGRQHNLQVLPRDDPVTLMQLPIGN